MFKWVPPGVYDYQEFLVRYVIGQKGMPSKAISKMWLDKGGPEDLDAMLTLPWGSYPDFPAKPPKN